MPLETLPEAEPEGWVVVVDELLLSLPCASRLTVFDSIVTLPLAEPGTDAPAEELGSEGVVAAELDEEEPGVGALAAGGGVLMVVDELLEGLGPPESRSTRSSPQPASATATAEAETSNRNFAFIGDSLSVMEAIAEWAAPERGPRQPLQAILVPSRFREGSRQRRNADR